MCAKTKGDICIASKEPNFDIEIED